MSSIRLFILDAFERYGAMHGYELKRIVERERIDQWTDISVSAIYGALRRVASDGLLTAEQVEREGKRPTRQVFALTEAGRLALAELRRTELETVMVNADPFDLALTHSDPARLDELPATIQGRLARLRVLLSSRQQFSDWAGPHISLAKAHALCHREFLLRAEIAWHEQLLDAADDIIGDERSRNETHQ
ncbi:PadR family transcriptional regulator [Microlunatus elymi]|uniref:PadR family transcriptional regulator n=1 Tax=Microlunatus elymi TaxID=2596828 RepID=A0A516Q2T5_9ACTN|nr:PadR family transcriptional regulator [Microlunatus elymi]QDP97743.1 PadR family transcriptional regulator [Microlunatus elymi]